MSSLRDGLPALYRPLFPAFFDRSVPEETKATCGSCAMLEGSATPAVQPVDGTSRFFRRETKCCTYHPRLPNYLVGALLADIDPALAEGQKRVRERIAAGVGITPQWVRAPARYDFLYDRAHKAFGRTVSLRCPYYAAETGFCTIWKHREAVCSTFFCKYVAGADGRKFWMSLKSWLALTEIQLTRWVLLQLMPGYVLAGKDREKPDAPLTASDLDEAPPDAKARRELWGEFTGRETELYARAHALVSGLDATGLEKILGLDGGIHLAMLEEAWKKATSDALPARLRFNPNATVQWLDRATVAMASYSDADAVALPGEVYSLLTDFTGSEPVDKVRRAWREERATDLDDALLLELYRHRILTDA